MKENYKKNTNRIYTEYCLHFMKENYRKNTNRINTETKFSFFFYKGKLWGKYYQDLQSISYEGKLWENNIVIYRVLYC